VAILSMFILAVLILTVTITHWRLMMFNIIMMCHIVQCQCYYVTDRTRQCTTIQQLCYSIHLDIENRYIIIIRLPLQTRLTYISTL
jgi:hypothetical protein